MWNHLRSGIVGGIVAGAVILAGSAVAGSGIGGVFNLGQTNSVNHSSVLAGATAGTQAVFYNASTATNAAGAAVYGKSATAPALQAANLGSGPALGLSVAAGHAPFTVNSATKIANLNADRLDGLDSSQLQAKLTVEAWHEVGTAGQPAFLRANVGGNDGTWRNGAFADATVAFFRDPFGVVHLKGALCFAPDITPLTCSYTNLSDDVAVFQLPAGYRPAAYQAFPIVSTVGGAQFGAVLIDPSGTVLLRSPTNPDAAWLDGITFRVGS